MKRAVVVEDFEPLAKVWKGMLLELGFDAVNCYTCATSYLVGEQESELPSLVLLDINLKNNTNGIDLARDIRKGNTHSKIVFVSMHHDDYYIEQCKPLGISGFISKSMPRDLIQMGLESIMHAHDEFLDLRPVF